MADKKYYDPMYTYTEFESYKSFAKQKQDIKSKYPSDLFNQRKQKYSDEQRNLYQQYIKELLDVIFEKDGNFQQLTWDMMNTVDRLEMERNSRSSKRHNSV